MVQIQLVKFYVKYKRTDAPSMVQIQLVKINLFAQVFLFIDL